MKDENHSDDEYVPPKMKKQQITKRYYCYDDMAYYKKLSSKKQKHIDEIEAVLMKKNKSDIPIRFKILESQMDDNLKALAISKVDQLTMLDPSSSEYCKLFNWIESLCKIPINVHKKLPVASSDGKSAIANYLTGMKAKFDEVVYGHNETKDQIIRLIAKWISNPSSKGLVIGIEGVHGIGKTSLIKDGICQYLGLPFGFVTLGGISDGSYLVGHSFTYEGSKWGKIADVLMKAGCMNPILYFDELDKISTTRHGDEIANLLIHLTDSSQNDRFQDKYFMDLDLDLSKCLMIFSYNHVEMVNPILKDRMIVIKAKGYSIKDKHVIAQKHLIPAIMREYGFTKDSIIFDEDSISYIVSRIEQEEGVRNLKRALEDIVSHINIENLLHNDTSKEDVSIVKVDTLLIDKYIKKKEPSFVSTMYI